MRLGSNGTQGTTAARDRSRRRAMLRMLRKLGVKLSSLPHRSTEPAEVDPSLEAVASNAPFRH